MKKISSKHFFFFSFLFPERGKRKRKSSWTDSAKIASAIKRPAHQHFEKRATAAEENRLFSCSSLVVIQVHFFTYLNYTCKKCAQMHRHSYPSRHDG
jgi:hypothetical protein